MRGRGRFRGKAFPQQEDAAPGISATCCPKAPGGNLYRVHKGAIAQQSGDRRFFRGCSTVPLCTHSFILPCDSEKIMGDER